MAVERAWLENLEMRRLLSADLGEVTILPFFEEESTIVVDETVVDESALEFTTLELVDPGTDEAIVDDSELIYYTMIDFGTEEPEVVDAESVEGELIDPAICYFGAEDGRGVDENGEIQPNFRGGTDEVTEETVTDIETEVITTMIDETLVDPIPLELIDPNDDGVCGWGGIDESEVVITATCEGFGPAGEETLEVTSAPDEEIIYTILPYFEPTPVVEEATENVATAPTGPAPESTDDASDTDSIFSELEIASSDEVLG